MTQGSGKIYIGTSGYHYDHWQGVFYPESIQKNEWFDYYSQRFSTVEINNTFYNLPKEETFNEWKHRAPDHFFYSLKFSQYGTHIKKLKDPEKPIQRFTEMADKLGLHLGPILVQLPPKWKPNPERLDAFLEATPNDYRWCVEFRDSRWFTDEVFDILKKHNTALCLHDMIDDHPQVITAGWTYLRFHGDHYTGSYNHQALTACARQVHEYKQKGMDVYIYFNNDEAGHAVNNALDLKRYVENAESN